ncbi:MAG: PadR family transcriptional regulator [Gemmatimonadales bacterium]
MGKHNDDWGLGDIFGFAFDPLRFDFRFGEGNRGGRGRRRRHMFESGEVKFVILRLLREKPRHGYDIIKALEERMAGCYTPSAGTVYPTLQLLQDQGYVRAEDQEGKKVYHITPEGERFLDENRDTLDDIFERVRDTVRDFTGGRMGDLNQTFAKLASTTFKRAWRWGPDHPAMPRVIEILQRATAEIEAEWEKA